VTTSAETSLISRVALAASDLDQLAKFVTDKIQGIDGVQRTITVSRVARACPRDDCSIRGEIWMHSASK